MAGRIRTIKPELLENERVASLPHDAWRLFVSLLLLADDYGNLNGHPDRIQAAVFWAQQPLQSIRDCLATLSERNLVRLYTVRGTAGGQAEQ